MGPVSGWPTTGGQLEPHGQPHDGARSFPFAILILQIITIKGAYNHIFYEITIMVFLYECSPCLLTYPLIPPSSPRENHFSFYHFCQCPLLFDQLYHYIF